MGIRDGLALASCRTVGFRLCPGFHQDLRLKTLQEVSVGWPQYTALVLTNPVY